MPVVTPTEVVEQFGWPLGLNRDAFEINLDPRESPDLLNVDLDLRGSFSPRAGYAQWDSGAMSNPAAHLGQHRPESGADVIIVVEEGDGSIWFSTTTVLSDTGQNLGTASGQREWHIDSTQLADYTYVASLRGNTRRFDGSTWLEITDTQANGSGDNGTPEFPQSQTIESHYSRVFAANLLEGGVRYRSRLMWSTLASGTDQFGGNRWEALSFIDVNEDDGDEIRKIISFQSSLIIFKDSSVWILSGSDEAAFSLFALNPQVGTTAPNTVAAEEGRLFFFDPFDGAYMFDGVNVTKIDTQLRNYILSGMNASFAYRSQGWTDGFKYFLCVPWGADTFPSRTFVFDVRLQSWTEYDFGWYDTITYTELQYTVGNKNQAGVFNFRQGDTLDDEGGAGDPISWYFNTIWFPIPEGQGMREHRLRRVDVFSEADSIPFDLDIYVDGDNASSVYTETIDGSKTRTKLPGLSRLWSIIKFKMSGDTQ